MLLHVYTSEIEKLKRMLEEEREKVKDRENRIQRLLSVSSEISGDVSSKGYNDWDITYFNHVITLYR